jgi:hypothetical protein
MNAARRRPFSEMVEGLADHGVSAGSLLDVKQCREPIWSGLIIVVS